MDDRPLLSISDVAARLKISRWTVQRWIDEGVLTAVRVGRQIRVDPADLEAYIERNKIDGNGGGAA